MAAPRPNATTNGGKSALPTYKLEQFKALRELGTGSFGAVHQVVDKQTNDTFAMKVIEKQKVIDKGLEEQLKCEVLTQLRAHHANVLGMKYYFEDSGKVYCLLEYADRGQLFAYLKKFDGGIPEPRAASFFLDTVQGVQYLHSNRIVHRDLKPENILLFGDRLTAKIGDLGWCAQLTPERPTRQTFCGTMDYLAPELVKNEPHDFAVDLWALGVLLYEMLMARAPFAADSQKGTIESICRAQPAFPPGCISSGPKALIVGLLRLSKSDRIGLTSILQHPWMASMAGNTSLATKPSPAVAAAHAADAAAGTLDATRMIPRGMTPQATGTYHGKPDGGVEGAQTPPLPVVGSTGRLEAPSHAAATAGSVYAPGDLDSTVARDLDARMGQALDSLDKSFVGRLNGHHDRERNKLEGIRKFTVPDAVALGDSQPSSPSSPDSLQDSLRPLSGRLPRTRSKAFGESLHPVSPTGESHWFPPVGKDSDLLGVVDDERIDLEELDRQMHRQFEGGRPARATGRNACQPPLIRATRGPRGHHEPAYLASALLLSRGEDGSDRLSDSPVKKPRPKKAVSKGSLDQPLRPLGSSASTAADSTAGTASSSLVEMGVYLGSFFGLGLAASQDARDGSPQR